MPRIGRRAFALGAGALALGVGGCAGDEVPVTRPLAAPTDPLLTRCLTLNGGWRC